LFHQKTSGHPGCNQLFPSAIHRRAFQNIFTYHPTFLDLEKLLWNANRSGTVPAHVALA
jgi:hypothetical protein